ncbi:MAG: SusC/RagA family TonB-linked outer membrane protein [Bacteroidales bacterium]|nr:SusC/RagA family TonB-linked outer membrane protein [Bacteroidales bacterium]
MKPDFITKMRLHALMCLFILLPFVAAGQQMTITGTVVDEFGEALPGVTVFIDGTTRGVSTDIDGKYSISASPGEVLVFSSVGMNTRKITVGAEAVINVTLNEATEEIESVVVVGYGVQKKETVTGAVSQISGERLKDVKMGGAIENSLQGVLPGMVVLMQDATPGEESKSITMQIRAGASMGSNSPLILVDGVERSFTNLDPEEISSISILKDASATAVYGVKGANGVVIVNTKRGSEGALQLDFSAETSLKMATRLPKYMNSYETMLLRNEAYKNDGKWSSLISDEALEHYRTGDSPWLYPDFDWMDFYFKPAFDQNYNINARGGNSFVKYFVSLGYLNESDIFDVGSIFPTSSRRRMPHTGTTVTPSGTTLTLT